MLPLDGVRVLDLTRNVAGPYATMILAELGADVVKVEAPGRGDDTRAWPPFWQGESASFLALNRNKRSVILDLKDPASRPVMERAIIWADVLVESFRPGALEEIGFGRSWAKDANPSIVWSSIGAYGHTGPLAPLPGYDPIMQGFGGLMSVTGEPQRSPVRVGVSIIDMGTGLWTALGVLAALLTRVESGTGTTVDAALYETSLAWMSNHIAGYWASGDIPGKVGSGIIACGNDALFAKLLAVLDLTHLADDLRFGSNAERVAHREILHDALEAVTRGWNARELVEALRETGVPCGPIRDVRQVAQDDQAEALGIFQSADHDHIDNFVSVGLPLQIGAERPPLRRAPPQAGEHNNEFFNEIGCTKDELRGMR